MCKTLESRVSALALLVEIAETGGRAWSGPVATAPSIPAPSCSSCCCSCRSSAGRTRRACALALHAVGDGARALRLRGLRNLGATCYLNSLFQQMYMIPEFRRGIIELPVASSLPPPPEKGSSEPNRCFLAQLQLMFGYLHESQRKWYDTRELCSSWRDYEHLPINPSIQMDVDEFYNMALSSSRAALKDTPGAKLLQGLFGGTTVSQIVSKDASKPGALLSERHEAFYTISIDVKCKKTVVDSLAAYVEGEVLDGDNKYKCESGEYVEAVKRTCVDRLPPVLILHLKRFEFDFEAMKKVKVDDHFEFPHTINMRPYTVDALSPSAGDRRGPRGGGGDGNGGERRTRRKTRRRRRRRRPRGASPAGAAGSAGGGSARRRGRRPALRTRGRRRALAAGQVYELVGVLVHSGTADSGHYYSYIKERRARVDGAPDGARGGGGSSWLHFNDTLVEPFDERDIPKACYGGVEPVVQWDAELQKHVQRMAPKPHSAYMLFYERVAPPERSERAPPPMAEARRQCPGRTEAARRPSGAAERRKRGAEAARAAMPRNCPSTTRRAARRRCCAPPRPACPSRSCAPCGRRTCSSCATASSSTRRTLPSCAGRRRALAAPTAAEEAKRTAAAAPRRRPWSGGGLRGSGRRRPRDGGVGGGCAGRWRQPAVPRRPRSPRPSGSEPPRSRPSRRLVADDARAAAGLPLPRRDAGARQGQDVARHVGFAAAVAA